MSQEHNMDDETLGRWLSGELKGKELEQFEASDAFKTYQAIAEYSSQLEAPEYDLEQEYKKLHTTKHSVQDKPTVLRLPLYRRLGLAAGFVLLIGLGLYWMFNNFSDPSDTSVFTAQGETKEVILPDNSVATLNVASTINYNEEEWDVDRQLHLDGEAYFDVEKGSKFTVNTEHGKIEVLGTEFNVRSRQQLTEVICYEGKVRVTDLKNESVILEPGMAAKIVEGELEADWAPAVSTDADWKNGSSTFHAAPYENVVEELENQYQISIEVKSDIKDRVYYGAFPHDNLEQALQMVAHPMQLNYTIISDTVVVIE